ncbi:T9SS type A sorting domain-containing protein [Odoribacter sp. OttesenSCG-928-L07]|nr:T9SS type A sorting domain-containing protein [Odoribacter sp. OttesenSCG-928-L07]MDL2238709.1 T9SS type A sorting domain-containing protein [Bacteroidales bacterium OttesenSCG-928-L14]
MKALKFTLIIILLSVVNLYGQDYQSINSGKITYFETSGFIRSIRIDLTEFDTDSVLYPFKIMQEVDWECYSPDKASWIGEKIVIKDNGDNIFFNRNDQEIIIKTKAELNEKWIAFEIPDVLIVEAEIIEHEIQTFLGLDDYVKTIEFKAYDKDMAPVNNEINNKRIGISENYGFTKILDFYNFPEFESSNGYIQEHNLVGLSNPEVGIQNLTKFEVFDHEVGDELHVYIHDYYDVYGYYEKSMYKYIERTDYQDSIVYSCKRTQTRLSESYGEMTSFVFIDDTIKTVITRDIDFDRLPEEVIGEEERSSYHLGIYQNVLSKRESSNSFLKRDDDCWELLLVDGCLIYNRYMKGLGGPYYYCNDWMMTYERSLVYYKKGDETWGTPYNLTGISEIENENKVNVFPNPSKDGIIYVVASQNINSELTIDVFDIQGKKIKSEQLDSNYNVIDLSGLRKGMYLYRISDGRNVLQTDKIVVE